MQEVRVAFEDEHGLEQYTDALDTLAREVLPQGYGGLSTDPKGVRLFVEDFVSEKDIAALIGAIRAFKPPEPEPLPAPREPSKAEMLGWLAEFQRELDRLRAVIEKSE